MDKLLRKRLRSHPFNARSSTEPFQRIPYSGRSPIHVHDGLFGVGDYARKSVETFFQNTGFFRPTPGGGEDVTDPFIESWVVYVCSVLLSDKVASIPLQVWDGPSDKASQVKESDPVVSRLKKPNRDTTWSQFAARGVVNRRLSGEDIWFLMDLVGNPKVEATATQFDIPEQIVNVSGAAVEDRRDTTTGRITDWRYDGGTTKPPWFPTSSIVHFADYDPSDPQRGLGAVDAAMRQIGLAYQSERYQESVMRSGGPGGFLIAKQGMGPEQEESLQARMDDSAKDPEAAMRMKLLTGDWDVKPNTVAPKDMAALEWLRWARDVIAHLMRVPLPVIGILDSSTYNNLDTAWREFWTGVRDYLNGVAEVMNSAFFPRLKGPASQYRCSFDFSKVKYLREIDRADIELAMKIAASGIGVSLNDALAALKVEIDPVNGGERQLIGAMLVEAEAFDAEGGAPASDAPAKNVPARRKLRHPALADVKVRAEYHAGWLIRAGVHRHERRLALSVKRYLSAYEKAQIERLRHFAEKGAAGLEPNPPTKSVAQAIEKISAYDVERWLLLYQRDWEALLADSTSTILASAFENSLADAARELGMTQIDGTDPRVLAFLKNQEFQLTEGVTSTLADRVKLQLLDVLQGATNTADLQLAVREMLPELTDRMRSVFGTKEARALTIARTETAHSANGAKFMQYRDAGVARIQWVSEGDAAVRESHREVDGEIVGLGEHFTNGLMYPSDPEGAASEVINCRCGFVAVDEEGT